MIELQGKHASARIMTDYVEAEAISQIYTFLNHQAFDGLGIRIMPDVHAGKGAVVGFTSTLGNKIIPNVVGVDIGCGVAAARVSDRSIDFANLDHLIRECIPSGFSINASATNAKAEYREVAEATGQSVDRVNRSVCSLGGGNHFIEIDRDQSNQLWLVVHTGSRNFGLQIANFHQRKAKEWSGNHHGLEWLEGNDAQLYLQHMKVAQQFARQNRIEIIDRITAALCIKPDEFVQSVHNYIDFSDNVIRKGAISARQGEKVIIPFNMRDGTIIGTGKGNDDWNNSAPHGAGRTMSRSRAKRELTVDEFKRTMDGIWTSCVGFGTLDESPMAYKNADEIQALINDTVDIELTLKPVYNFKAGEQVE